MPMVAAAVVKEVATEMTVAVTAMVTDTVVVDMIMGEAMVVAAATAVVVVMEAGDMAMLDMAAVVAEQLIIICHVIRLIVFIFPV